MVPGHTLNMTSKLHCFSMINYNRIWSKLIQILPVIPFRKHSRTRPNPQEVSPRSNAKSGCVRCQSQSSKCRSKPNRNIRVESKSSIFNNGIASGILVSWVLYNLQKLYNFIDWNFAHFVIEGSSLHTLKSTFKKRMNMIDHLLINLFIVLCSLSYQSLEIFDCRSLYDDECPAAQAPTSSCLSSGDIFMQF